MNIVLISFIGAIKGAAATYYLSQLSSALSKTNNITVILPKYARVDSFDKAINIIKFSFPSNFLKAMLNVFKPSLYRSLMNEIHRINPDIIHIVFELRFPFFFALLLSRNYPLVVTIHEPKPFSVKKNLKSFIKDAMQIVNCNLLIRCSSRIIVHGRKHKEYLSKKVSSSKIEIIPHGDFSLFITSKSERGIRTSKNNILFFGRIEDYKGIEYLIQAGKLAKQYIPTINITIAGAGDFAKYRKLIGHDDSFLVINRFISEEKVAELFQKASLVVLSYTDGSQSGIISIAYAFEKPVIATNVGNLAEMVEDGKTGFIIPPRNVESLSDAMINVLKNDKLREEMGKNGKKLLKNFTWDGLGEKLVKIYKEIDTHDL